MEPAEDDFALLLDRGGTLLNRQLERTKATLRELPESQRKQALLAVGMAQVFGVKKVIDPGFQRLVEQRTAPVGWMRRHAKELARLILLDLLLPRKPTVRDAVRARTSRPRRHHDGMFVRVDDRDLRRLMTEYYPELFVRGGRSDIGLRKDARVRPMSTIHGNAGEGTDISLAIMIGSMMAAYSSWVGRSPQFILETCACIRLVEPRALQSLAQFWQDLNEVLEDIRTEFGRPRPDRMWIVSQIRERGPVVERLHQEIRWLLEARWFRSRSRHAQQELVRTPPAFPYTRRDAVSAVSRTQAWLKDSRKTVNRISQGADAYARLGLSAAGIWLYTELLRQVKVDDAKRARCHYNLAVCYRIEEMPGRMATELRKALDIQRKGGQALDIALTLAALAEANYMMQRRTKASRSRNEAERLLLAPRVPPQHKAYGFLQIADCAQRLGLEEWELTSLDSAFDAARESKDTDLQMYLSQRLTDLNAGLSGKIPEDGPGRFSHPAERLWEIPRSDLFVTAIRVKPRSG